MNQLGNFINFGLETNWYKLYDQNILNVLSYF